MEVKNVRLDELKEHPRNPRVHPDSALDKLVKSINEFGWTNPVLVSKDGYILAGHARCKAAQKAGLEEVPVIFLDLEGEKADAYLIADNKIQEETEWDIPLLTDLIKDLGDNGFDVSLTSFEAAEIDELFGNDTSGSEDIEEDDFDTDAAVAEIETPISQRGDIWLLGRHRLMCGDSTSLEDINILMDCKKARHVFTDPPWNVDYGSDAKHPSWKSRQILNDKMPTEQFKEFMEKTFNAMKQVCEPGCITYVVMSAQEWGSLMNVMSEAGYHWSSTVIWKKDSLVLSRKDYHTQYEPIWYGWLEGSGRLCPLKDRKQSDVWEVPRPKRSEEHPTMKPIALVAKAIVNSSHKSDLVLDLFGGSGTTILAAEQTERVCHSMELDPKYADVIVKRYYHNFPENEIKLNGYPVNPELLFINS